MTDILVRVPRSEIEHFWADHDGDTEWWTLGRKPTKFLVGDWVFFALGNEVVAYARDAKPVSGKLDSDDGRTWFGEHVVWQASKFAKLETPIPLPDVKLQVPRGFAYCGHTELRALVTRSKA